MQVVPTLLTKTTDEFIKQMGLFQKIFNRIQLDIADNTLVPNKTVKLKEILDLISDKKIQLVKNITFDLHLMVEDYTKELNTAMEIIKSGLKINLILINEKLSPDLNQLLEKYPFDFGLDIFPETQIKNTLDKYDINYLKHIQIMTVSPGFQGSLFLPEMLEKITYLRKAGFKGEILIDGGINDKTIKTISTSLDKPDILCIGSYLTKETSEDNIRLLTKNIQM
jgi:ribulose-phosphate 3-epimerase